VKNILDQALLKKIKECKTIEQLHTEVLAEEKKDFLNIQAVRDFADCWKTFIKFNVDSGWLLKFETNILEMLQVHWGSKAFIEVDRVNSKIECYGPDGRMITL
jgi:hypothetical protein